ncbi:serine/threonine-protein kinase [Actinomadura sp. DC4]|uniref:serine/threonine-protein kinase n=1 Tax=Actinomadura sp. DC4 TaxID=3055069 RepID=UPI0025B04A16|nr:serine/threonine-protein kinase [Actinomadura sp. DC4]MDN3353846.1 serine/threonine-protein kinase [Actinomadura sp. DC4]
MRVGDRYELLSRLGQGGMGTVWRAHDELLGRDVAVKEVLLPPGMSETERGQRHARTIREARSAARLSHPGVVTVHDVVEHEGRPWIVMELVSAPSLQDVIDAEGPLPPRRVAALGRQTLAALRAAHAAGIVHRDVKPSNVLVAGADRVVVTDFGIAALEGDATLTGTGVLIGSPAYIAPERARGEHSGPASDLWSLGATLYAAVEGRSPFERSGPVSTLAAIMAEEPPPPLNAGPLTPVLAGLLRRDPVDRMTAAEADRVLGQVAEGTRPPAGDGWTLPVVRRELTAPADLTLPAAPVPVPVSSSRRPAMLVAASALAGALVVAAFGAVWVLGRPSADERPHTGASSFRPLDARTTPPAAATGAAGVAGSASPAAEHWTTRSESGFSVPVPSSWSRRVDGDNVFYEDASTQLLLQVGTTSWDADPQTQAQAVSASVARSFRGYREAAVTPTTYLGVPAADLRFAYDRSTGTERVIDRFFRIGGQCFAIYFRMPADQWANSSSYLDPIFNGFHVG